MSQDLEGRSNQRGCSLLMTKGGGENMCRASICCALTLTLAVLSTGSLNAEEPQRPSQTRAVEGILTDESGGQLKFSIPEGGSIRLKRKGDPTVYRLLPQKLGNGQATFSLLDAESNEVREIFKLGLDGQAKSGVATPFSLSLLGIETKTSKQCAPKATSEASTANGGGAGTDAECCIYDCGPWIYFCCEPSSGWCCTLECVDGNGNLVGDSCSACTS